MVDWINKQFKRMGKFFSVFGTGICFAVSLIFPADICAKESDFYAGREKYGVSCEADIENGQENTAIAALADFGNYKRENHKLWRENYIQWELYDSESVVRPSGHMSISYTLYVPRNYLNKMDSALSIVHGTALVDEKKQYMGMTRNRGQSWFEPTCNGNGGLAMLRWDMAADEQAAADYASYKIKGDFYVIKVKNAPLSSYLNYDLSKFISKKQKVSIIPTIRVYGIGVSGQAFLMLDDITVRNGSKVLFRADCQDIGQEDGIFYEGRTDRKYALRTVVIGDEMNAAAGGK